MPIHEHRTLGDVVVAERRQLPLEVAETDRDESLNVSLVGLESFRERHGLLFDRRRPLFLWRGDSLSFFLSFLLL